MVSMLSSMNRSPRSLFLTFFPCQSHKNLIPSREYLQSSVPFPTEKKFLFNPQKRQHPFQPHDFHLSHCLLLPVLPLNNPWLQQKTYVRGLKRAESVMSAHTNQLIKFWPGSPETRFLVILTCVLPLSMSRFLLFLLLLCLPVASFFGRHYDLVPPLCACVQRMQQIRVHGSFDVFWDMASPRDGSKSSGGKKPYVAGPLLPCCRQRASGTTSLRALTQHHPILLSASCSLAPPTLSNW